MFNLSDKELDRLSRKAADAYEVENNTSSWEVLQQRLDKELAPSPKPSIPSSRIFRFPFSFASVVILLVGISYFLLKPNKNTPVKGKKDYTLLQQQNADKTSNLTSAEPVISKNKTGIHQSANESPLLTIPEKKLTVIASSGEKITSLLNSREKGTRSDSGKENPALRGAIQKNAVVRNDGTSSGDKSPAENNSIIGDIRKRGVYSSQKEKRPFSDGPATQNHPSPIITDQYKRLKGADKAEAVKSAEGEYSSGQEKTPDKSKSTAISSPEDIPRYLSTLIAPIKHPAVIIKDSSLRAEMSANNLKDIVHLNKKSSRSLNTNRSLEIGVSFAPDFSEVKHTDYANRLGTGVGITLGYQLLHRLSVNTGLIYSHKYYQADDESFHLSRDLPPAGLRIEYVNGSVKMLEIPLNLRYDVSFQGNTTFFVNGGLSSYVILKQNYLYFCRPNNSPSRAGWYVQEFNSPQDFWFSTVNISAGFETSLSKNLTFQVEPYVKISMKGVGAGNVQLNSYGINLAFKFAPVIKRSRE